MLILFFIFIVLFHCCFCICPNGTKTSFTNPDNCYLFVSEKSEFITAEDLCLQNGGHLTSIHSAFDNMFLSQEAISKFSDSTDVDFWIGGTNELNLGRWSWIDGTPFDFTDWSHGQPNNFSSAQCVAVSITDALWTADDCFKPKNFACLIPAAATTLLTTLKTTTTTTTTTTTKKPLSCSSGWKYFETTGFCYKAFSNLNLTWMDSEKYCIRNNAHLASIHSQTEDDFVADMARHAFSIFKNTPSCFLLQCWIGLTTVTNGAVYTWCDGTPFDYIGWSPGEPNGAGIENCVQLMLMPCGGDNIINLWNDNECSLQVQNFVCKKPRV